LSLILSMAFSCSISFLHVGGLCYQRSPPCAKFLWPFRFFRGDGKPGMVARFLQCGRNRPQLRTLAGYCNLYSVETCLLQVSWVIIRCSKGERTNMSLV
jgi:hypothetical protein